VGRAATSDEAEHLATRSLNAKRPWRPIEAHAIEVSKQGVHGGVQEPAARRTVSPTRSTSVRPPASAS
jgi:hypothetical protein